MNDYKHIARKIFFKICKGTERIKNSSLMSDISILDGPFILPHLDKMQHEDERSGTPYFAIPLPSVTLRTEPASLGFLCSFLLLLLSPVFGPCSVERVCPTLLLCSFQPQAPPKHIIINRDV